MKGEPITSQWEALAPRRKLKGWNCNTLVAFFTLMNGGKARRSSRLLTRHVILARFLAPTQYQPQPTPLFITVALMASIRLHAFSALCRRNALGGCIRHYATELPRPPPSTNEPVVETFSATSKPRPYYDKHPSHRELPKIKVRPRCICPFMFLRQLL